MAFSTCPQCGKPSPAPGPCRACSATAPRKTLADLDHRVLSVVFVAVAVFALWAFSTGPRPPSARADKPTADEAWWSCRDAMTRDLKAPSTAVFSSDPFVKPMDDQRFSVAAHVDSQNSFGAMLRSHFTCVARYEGDGRWTIEHLGSHG
jgi:hypothetical protein